MVQFHWRVVKINYKIASANKFYTKKLQAFHVYKKTSNNKNYLGKLFYITAGDWRRIFLRKRKKKKTNKIRGVMCRNKQVILRQDGSYRKFFENSVILLKKKVMPTNRKVSGTTLLEVSYKRYLTLFKNFF